MLKLDPWEEPEEPGGALRLAAESMAPLSQIIFRTILCEMPESHTHDFEVARELFRQICQGYRWYSSAEGPRLASIRNPYSSSDTSVEHATWVAVQKC